MKTLLCVLLFTQLALGKTHGNPDAPKGGTFVFGMGAYPKSLMYYLGWDTLSDMIAQMVFETLLDTDPETYDFLPGLASKWEVSKDKKTFTFTLNDKAKFSDGTPVTAHDVKFTWDTINDPKNKTAPFQAYLSSIGSCTVVDDKTVKFEAKTLNFTNLEKLGGLYILPKHYFSKGDFNKNFNSKFIGSGPYSLDSVSHGEKVILKRNTDYWAKDLPQNIGKYNFDKFLLKVVADPDVEFETFKKGEIDYFSFSSAKMWATQTDSAPFQNKYVLKIKAENKYPPGLQAIVWNNRKPLFNDVKVRTALSHLMNREQWMKELFYNSYVPGTGIMALNSEYHSPKLKPLPYDPKKARQLLKEAGWSETGSDGILVRKGERFEFEILANQGGMEKVLTRYQEDLKKAGIKMNIRMVDWATGIKLVDDRQFDAKIGAWTRSVNPSDFAVIWGSKEADVKGSANHSGYKNPEVDTLAQKVDETFDKKARIKLVRQLDEIIARDQPYSFTWEVSYLRIGHTNKFSFPKNGYLNYSGPYNMFHYWWLDPKKEEALKKAMSSGKPVS